MVIKSRHGQDWLDTTLADCCSPQVSQSRKWGICNIAFLVYFSLSYVSVVDPGLICVVQLNLNPG